MPAWSNISCAQWIERLRAPKVPFSLIGVRPAARITGARSRLILVMLLMVLRGADVDVHHHGLRPAGHQIGAVRHRDREVLVRHHHRPRHLRVGLLGPRESLDDRREIGARIAEEKVDAVIGERAQEGVGGDRRPVGALGAWRSGMGAHLRSFQSYFEPTPLSR